MRRGRREKPVIGLNSIKAALKSFGYGNRDTSEATSLETLALVDLHLAQMSRPSAENLRAYTLHQILASFLQDGLNEQRRLFDLAPVSEKVSRKSAEIQLAEISTTHSFSVKAWACLYYRYFRADLGFSVEELSNHLGFGLRNFPRHEDDGFRLLRDKLITEEWNARKTLLRRILKRQIPEAIVPLLGRDKAMDAAISALQDNPPMPVLVTGAEGIGKSAFLANLTNELIEANELDYLVWISRPKRLEDIYNALEDSLLPYPSRLDWRGLLGDDKLLLVIDDISQLTASSEEWERLSGLLSPAYLLIATQHYGQILNRFKPIPLTELNSQDSLELIKTYTAVDAIDKLQLENLGGNPRYLAYAAQLILAGKSPQKAEEALRLRYDENFSELSQAEHLAWIGTAAGIKSDLEILVDKNLQNPSAQQYIISRYTREPSLQRAFQAYLENSVPMSLFFLDWVKLDKSFVLRCLQGYKANSIAELRQWKNLASVYLEVSDISLRLDYGAALRQLYDVSAEAYLQDLIQNLGQTGDFIHQAKARYELALLYQSHAQFEKALAHYDAIEVYRQLDKRLYQNILLQRARIAIEKGDGASALNYLLQRKSENQEPIDSVLEAEAYLLLGEMEKCQEKAYFALKIIEDNPQLRASLHTIIGRSSHSKNALEHLHAALSISEQFNSDFDIARAKTNLAGAYLNFEKNKLDEAEELLYQALEIQKRIQDTVGFHVSQLNLNYLQSLRINYKG